MFILRFLVVYLPFEEFVLKWLPVGDIVYAVLRQVPDMFIFGLMGALLLGRLGSGKLVPLIGGKTDLFLLLFVVWAFATILFTPLADAFVGIANIKALLRYVLLIYILLLLNPTEYQIKRLMQWFWFVVIAQVCVGLFQLVGGLSARDFLAARHVTEGIGGMTTNFTGDRFEGVNDLMGTMGNNISFAYLMMIGLLFWLLAKNTNAVKKNAIIILFVMLTFLSGSKAVFIVTLMILIGYYAKKIHWKRLFVWSALVIPLMLIVIWLNISDSVVGEMKGSYAMLLEGMMNSRLGIIVYVIPELLLTPRSVFGFSPDKFFFVEYVILNFPTVPFILIAVLVAVLEDVYWVALFVYYGLIGLICWLLFLYLLHQQLKRSINILGKTNANIAMIAMVLLLTSIPLNFLNQAFEVRIFSFYLWLFCGLALVQRRRTMKNWGKL